MTCLGVVLISLHPFQSALYLDSREGNDKKQTLGIIKAVLPKELQIRVEKKCRNLLCFKLRSSKTTHTVLLHMHHGSSVAL